MNGTIEIELPSVERSIAKVRTRAPGSIGDMMDYHLLKEDREKGEYELQCKTFDWMRNVNGTLHGGMCATAVDQALGFVAYSYIPAPGITPTIQLQLNYHRPLIQGEDVIVRVRVVAVTRTMIGMTFEAVRASVPEKICITGTGTSFFKLDKQ